LDNEEGITIEDVQAWRKDLVTIWFFEGIKELLEQEDHFVHSWLEKYDTNMASLHNASMDTYKIVMGLPQDMIDTIKEDEKNESPSV